MAHEEAIMVTTRARAMSVTILSFIALSITGCFSSQPKDIRAFLKPYEVSVTAKSYVLQPPDEIEILCSKVPEIHMQRQQIRPDGKISFEGLGEIEVAGKTVNEIANTLRLKVLQLYALTGENPIDVRIATYRSKMYYVLGEVYIPGPKIYTGRDTVLSAIAEARLNPMAWAKRIQVIRPSEHKGIRPEIFEVDFARMRKHGDTSKNVLLQEGDIIYVPPTILAALAMKIEEVIRPVARAFTGIYILQSGLGVSPYYYGGFGGF
jgi:protein involved in polysaccharide export with SLBB domain